MLSIMTVIALGSALVYRIGAQSARIALLSNALSLAVAMLLAIALLLAVVHWSRINRPQ